MVAQVAIVGAGLAGLCAAIRIKESGSDSFVVFEKGHDVGGVWRDNTYPGAGCDLPSCLYSYSFERDASWSRTYGIQPEILDYIRRSARRHGVYSHISFDTEVVRVDYDSARRLWRLRTATGEEHAARAVIMAAGQLNRPRLPDIKGQHEFAGTAFHSAAWQHERDLRGRSVAVIGNGCSAVQFVPRIAPLVERLHIYQRSPKWIIPKMDHEYATATRRVFQRHPWTQRLSRASWWAMAETIAYSPIHQGAFGRVLAAMARHHLRGQIPDPVLRRKLTPDYAFGCNRMILSNDYYPTLMRRNVELVTNPIRRITPDGIETEDEALREADTIIYATGFDSTTFLGPMEVAGPGGRLRDLWQDGGSAYLGIATPGFPNLFILYGPNTSSAANSVIYMIESQVHYVLRCLDLIGDDGTMEVTMQAFRDYGREIEADLKSTVWQGDCRSWYKTDSGRVTNLWPHRALRYRRATRTPNLDHYHLARPAGGTRFGGSR